MGIQLRPYQIRLSDLIIQSVLAFSGIEIDILQARQSGKTEAIVITDLALMVFFDSVLKKNFRTGVFAPAQSQAIQVFRRRVYERYSKIKPFLESFNITMHHHLGEAHFSNLFVLEDITTQVESSIRFMSGAPHGQIIGETFDLVVIEQVEDIEAVKMTSDIFPMLAAKGGTRLLSGTPSLQIVNTYFYETLTKPERQYDPVKNPKGAHIFVVDWKEAAKYSPQYRDYVTQEASRIGVDSDTFRTAYGIEWLLVRNKFITVDILNLLRETHETQTQEFPHYILDMKLTRVVGWDPARGEDRSVMTCVERDDKLNVHILEWKEWDNIDWEPQIIESITFLQHWKPSTLLVDSTGLGDPIPAWIRSWTRENVKFPLSIEGYHYTTETKDAINKLLDQEMHMKRVHYPVDTHQTRERAHFLEDFLNLERNYKGNYLNLDHPQMSGYHNDYCTSLELAVWACLKLTFKPYAGITELF